MAQVRELRRQQGALLAAAVEERGRSAAAVDALSAALAAREAELLAAQRAGLDAEAQRRAVTEGADALRVR